MVDRSVYFEALSGTLKSDLKGNPVPWAFYNDTCMPTILYWVTPGGAHAGYNKDTVRFEEGYPGYELIGGDWMAAKDVEDGSYFLAMSVTGGLAGVFLKDQQHPRDSTMTCADFLDPGDVGPIPEPDTDRPIPMDSPRVVVGCGMVRGGTSPGNVVVREQFWRLAPESYSLGPNETRTVSYTQTSGMESTTSEQETMSAALNVSASAGWGPVSASVSASLSDTTTTFQQVTLSSQQTIFVSRTLEPSGTARTVLYWQLTEVITAFGPGSPVPLASSISGLQPVLSRGPYDPDRLPVARRRSRMTAEERERAPRLDPAARTGDRPRPRRAPTAQRG